jgi:hypothetical protein
MLSLLLKSTRFWGLIGTGLIMYFLVFVVLAKTDVSWIMPDTNQIARSFIVIWPQMPFFTAHKGPAADGKGQEIYFTVPTRQFTPQEIARMEGTNRTTYPAGPK